MIFERGSGRFVSLAVVFMIFQVLALAFSHRQWRRTQMNVSPTIAVVTNSIKDVRFICITVSLGRFICCGVEIGLRTVWSCNERFL